MYFQPPQNLLYFVQWLLHTGKQRKSSSDILGGTRKLLHKLEFICFDYAKADFTAIFCALPCFHERSQVFAIARNRAVS